MYVLFILFFTVIQINAQEDNFVAEWRLDETSGTVAKDEIGGSDGTVNNLSYEARVPGFVDNCIDFSTSDSGYIQVEDNSTIDLDSTTSFTICALVKIADISGDHIIVFKGHTNDDISGHWYALKFKDNQLRIAIDDAVTKTQLEFENANQSMNMDDWNFVAGVRDIAQDSLFLLSEWRKGSFNA